MTGSTQLLFKWFKDLTEATEFANKRTPDSILEIKHYDNIEYKKSNRN